MSLKKHITAITFGLLSSITSLAALDAHAPQKVMHMPFEWSDASIPLVNIDINGIRQTFSIDTGSNTALHLTRDLMAQLPGLALDSEKHRAIDLAGNVSVNDKFHIPQLFINGMVFKDVKGVSFTPWGLRLTPESSIPNSMVIGLSLFKEKAVLIDYKSQRFSVAESVQDLSINMADDWILLPLRLTPEGIEISVTQEEKQYNMVLDTGATVSVFWRERLKSLVMEIPCRTVLAEVHIEGDIEGCIASVFQLGEAGEKRIKLNAMLLDGAFNQMNADGLIGNNFLQKFAVIIDFPAQQLLIKPF
ncbi:Uncharacterised protein [Yersinia enterocolitica]|uniref:aspartyl protease family protein n=1 Tax=Yersinia mollaretii TaxID=33060 RepID=UPI0005E76304|nr:aspartyl protease family protein [Yersinia mollaretii]CNK86484.1 Uncharacterised protein [Yersinia enterocolitica]